MSASSAVHTRRARIGFGALASLVLGTLLALAPTPALAEVPVVRVDRLDPVLVPVPSQARALGAATAGPAADAPAVVASQVDVETFHMVGGEVDAVPSAAVQMRVRQDGRWGEWFEVEVDLELGPDGDRLPPFVSEPVWVDDSDAYQVAAPADAGGLRVLVVRDDGTRLEPVLQEDEADAAPAKPAISTRASWGARPKRGTPVYADRLELAVVHHTVTSNDYAASQVPGILRSIQAFHQDGNGWSDIGYNFLVDRFGRIWEGNGGGMDLPVVGGHSRGFNTGSVGVSVLGDFTAASPNQATVDAVGDVVGWKLTISGVDPRGRVGFTTYGNERFAPGTVVDLPRVVGHRDTGATSCPGIGLYARLGDVRNRATDAHLRGSSPFGAVDGARGTDLDEVTVEGWVVDPDSHGPIDVHVYVDGQGAANVATFGERPDVSAIWPWITTPVRFAAKVRVGPGDHQLCAYGINRGTGGNVALGCTTGRAREGPPFGRLDVLDPLGPRTVEARGWAIDPDTSAPVDVRIDVDGVTAAQVRADRHRADLAQLYPRWGGAHGYAVPVAVSDGAQVCAYALDVVAPGSTSLLSCQRVTIPTGSPFGRLDGWRWRAPGTIRLSGWAIDPDTTAPAEVHVYDQTGAEPRGLVAVVADRARSDIDAAYPGWGPLHGFAVDLPLPKGERRLCAYGVDVAGGHGPTLLGCTTVGSADGAPLGRLEQAVAGPRSVRLTGWTVDPDVAESTDVHVYVDGVGRANVRADQVRTDLGVAWSGWNTTRGFDVTVGGLGPGGHDVCVYAIDRDGSAHRQLRCERVVIATGSPWGSLDVVAPAAGGGVRVAGWGIDPDTDRAIPVHVYADGVGQANVPASGARPDLATPFPGWSTAHGFDLVTGTGLAPGAHQVCVYLIDQVGGHGPVLAGCRTVTLPG